jgi:hypothetical protein
MAVRADGYVRLNCSALHLGFASLPQPTCCAGPAIGGGDRLGYLRDSIDIDGPDKQLTKGIKMFRLAESTNAILVHETLRDCLLAKGFGSDIAFYDLKEAAFSLRFQKTDRPGGYTK